uniref:AIG1-type G domain-containing protein n=1 Tax=Naja naja TaxID=35670 RepID=A0A8C6XRZ7_NAJNA
RGGRAHLIVGSNQFGANMELRLILVRKSGSGKNAMGNNILGRKEFESLLEAKTTTLQCQKGEGTWQRRKIPVVDTPGMFYSEGYDEILSGPSPTPDFGDPSRGFTTEDATAAKCVWDIFGPESTKHTIVVFTCVKDLSGSPLQEYVQKSDNRNLREVMRRCGYRVCGFNNKAEGDERERQVMELMTMVRSTVAANGGRYYTNRLYRITGQGSHGVLQGLDWHWSSLRTGWEGGRAGETRQTPPAAPRWPKRGTLGPHSAPCVPFQPGRLLAALRGTKMGEEGPWHTLFGLPEGPAGRSFAISGPG